MFYSVQIQRNKEYEFEAKVSGICAHSEYRLQLKEKESLWPCSK
jgi:hypothetical protein